MINLNNKYRPKKIEDFVGNSKLFGQNGILKNLVEKKSTIPSLILTGPSGTGKTSISYLLAESINIKTLYFNATKDKIADIKNKIDKEDDKILVYVDEIQYFNKKQQQIFLPLIEEEKIILIISTTENPYHNIIEGLISRCLILNFEKIENNEIFNKLKEISTKEGINIDENALKLLSTITNGDLRLAINYLSFLYASLNKIALNDIQSVLSNYNQTNTVYTDDYHYSLLSAMQKSIRGSDPNASIFYLQKIISTGDILSPIRRLLVIASEDIGLANPFAGIIAKSLCDSAKQVGLPEASIILSNLVIYLSLQPKSNSAYMAGKKALEDINKNLGVKVPPHIAYHKSINYKYPFDYDKNYVNQQYLPDDIKNHIYYTPCKNESEYNMIQTLRDMKNLN